MKKKDIKYREGEFELRRPTYIGDPPKDVDNYDVVRWEESPYYGHDEDYEWNGEYAIRDTHARIHKSCFNNPESCYTVGTFIKDREGYYEFKFCCDRPFDFELHSELFNMFWEFMYKCNEILK